MNRRDASLLITQHTAMIAHLDSIESRLSVRFDRVEARLDSVIDALAAHVADRDLHHGDPS